MRYLPVLLLLCCVACSAQVASKPAPQSPPSKAAAAQSESKPASAPKAPADSGDAVPATAPVITVNGVCSPAPPSGAATRQASPQTCTTTVTKAQFEKLLNALNSANQPIPPAMRRNLAQAYVELLAYSQTAEKAGVDKDARFIEVMRLVRMRTLADLYRRDLEEKFRTPPMAEVQAYYNQNLSRYEEIKLSRVFIPAKNTAAQNNKDDWEKKAAQVASDIHDRAAKGEDLDKLQKEAYTTLGLTIAPPNTVMGPRRRGLVGQSDEQELFALKPGEVSKLEQDPSGYIIYKVDSRQTLPLDQVKDEISRELFRQKMDAALKAVTASVKSEFNDQYFGASASPAPPSGRMEPQAPNRPASGQPPRPDSAPQSTNGGAQPPKAPPQ